MAELEETSVVHNTAGKFREKVVTFASVSDGDTFDARRVGIVQVVDADARMTGTGVVAADSLAVASNDGRTITFQQAGTARPATVTIRGH